MFAQPACADGSDPTQLQGPTPPSSMINRWTNRHASKAACSNTHVCVCVAFLLQRLHLPQSCFSFLPLPGKRFRFEMSDEQLGGTLATACVESCGSSRGSDLSPAGWRRNIASISTAATLLSPSVLHRPPPPPPPQDLMSEEQNCLRGCSPTQWRPD